MPEPNMWKSTTTLSRNVFFNALSLSIQFTPSDDYGRLISLWIAEGFVEGKRGKTLEEVADAYHDELINGCLVDANKRDFQGVIKAVPISVEKLWTSDKLLFPSCPKPSMEIKPVELFSGIGGFYHQYRSCHLSRQSSQGIAKELGNLTAMRKLGITELERKDGKDLCASIQKMKHLSSLLVISISEEEVLDLCHLSPLPSHRRFLLCIEMIYCPQKSSSLLKATIGRPEFVTLVFLGLRVAMGRLTSSQPKRKAQLSFLTPNTNGSPASQASLVFDLV
ncbi:hypothetical protein AAG906_037432 [Vitis piasezkii]